MTRRTKWIAIITITVLLIPIAMRANKAFYLLYRGSINVYEQQYQMGLFMQKYYHDIPLAFNDIGAVSYFTESRNLDLWGLGNVEIANAFLAHDANTRLLSNLIHRDSIRVAVIFDPPYPVALRAKWSKIASWRIPHNVICAYDIVTFYAIARPDSAALRQNLMDYEKLLPKDVMIHYY